MRAAEGDAGAPAEGDAVLYQGLLRSPASWARVGRGYAKALIEQGVAFAAVSPRGFGFDPSFPLPPGLVERTPSEARSMAPPRVGLGFLHPPQLDRLLGRHRSNLVVWEADRAPRDWIDALERTVDTVLAPSRFTRRALLDAGLSSERIVVAPYGYDAEHAAAARVERARRRQGRFVILSVLAPHHRKGVRELLTAYGAVFTHRDDVVLRLKSTYDPGRSRRRYPFEIASWEAELRHAGLHRSGAPRVELELGALDDRATIGLLADADLLAQPSWGEAFGLAILEALGVGVPVVTTAWSGPDDFFPQPRTEDWLPFRLTDAGDRLYQVAPGARVAVPDVDALAARLRWHHDHPAASRARGEASRVAVAGWTWDAAARRLLEALEERAGPLRPGPIR